MLTPIQARQLIEDRARLAPIEARIDALLVEHAKTGWPVPFKFPYELFSDVAANDLKLLLTIYADAGWWMFEAPDKSGKIDVIFEHPSKQFERGGPDDR